MWLSASCCLWPAFSPLNKQLQSLVPADICHSSVLAVMIRAARLTKGKAKNSEAAPTAMASEKHNQIKNPTGSSGLVFWKVWCGLEMHENTADSHGVQTYTWRLRINDHRTERLHSTVKKTDAGCKCMQLSIDGTSTTCSAVRATRVSESWTAQAGTTTDRTWIQMAHPLWNNLLAKPFSCWSYMSPGVWIRDYFTANVTEEMAYLRLILL